ncbi:hypothetical protein RND81_05G100000 [Saponaria officinalis]|uniref:Brf1 TBP-binding domain-containing protein n=1 Tax=Saponaria officinalis TaxID=3572 RepID=A0AAW1KVW7_SAPOF
MENSNTTVTELWDATDSEEQMENSNTTVTKLWDATDSEDDAVDFSDDKSPGALHSQKKGEDTKSSSDSEDLSDIKDAEVDSYLNNEKQKHYKKIIWEMMNRKYLKDLEARKKLAASNASNPKKKQRQKTAKDVKKAQPTAQQTSSKKRPSSRINHEALQKMFEEEPEPAENTKRARTESESSRGRADDLADGADDETEEQYGWDEDPSYSHYDAQDDDYYYGEDDEFF